LSGTADTQTSPDPAPAGTPGPAPSPPRWWQGWVPLVVLPAAVLLLTPAGWPPWALMWSLAFVIYGSLKWLTWRRAPVRGAPLWRHLGYLLAWPGLDPVAFLTPDPGSPPRKPTVREWLFASAKLLLGVGILFGLARQIPAEYPYWVGWAGMVGIIFVLHFGSFHLLSCAWRTVGVQARPLMDWPIASVSVSEFWGRRWNTAFRDLTHRFLFRPLASRLGPRGAILAGFVFSGLLHDLVVSMPPGGGYGGPTLFFLVQGLAIFFERSRAGRRLGLGAGWRGRLFTAAVLLGPVYLLFHPPFVEGVVVPFLRALGAIT
jgi:hypothetical protein